MDELEERARERERFVKAFVEEQLAGAAAFPGEVIALCRRADTAFSRLGVLAAKAWTDAYEEGHAVERLSDEALDRLHEQAATGKLPGIVMPHGTKIVLGLIAEIRARTREAAANEKNMRDEYADRYARQEDKVDELRDTNNILEDDLFKSRR